jgi:calcium-dependent protein kinase
VVSYVLLTGKMPFADWVAEREGRDATKEGLMREIRRGRPGTPIEELPLSPGAKSLLSALLTPDPEKAHEL